MNNIVQGAVQGSLFEEDYLIRTLGTLAHSANAAIPQLCPKRVSVRVQGGEFRAEIEKSRLKKHGACRLAETK